MKLTAAAVKAAETRGKAYKLADGKGLHLLVKPNGGKYWRMKYRYGGKEKTLALGVYPETSLAKAREKCQAARAQLGDGIDPSVTRRLDKINQQTEGANTFRRVAAEWYETQMGAKSDSYRDRTKRLLENDLYPALGHLPINQIEPPELLAALRKVERRGAVDMAHRAKQTAGQVFRYGVATGRCARDPSGDLRGALPARNKKHYAAITDPAQVGKLLVAIDGFEGTPTVKTALQLSPLLFQRPGEIRAMEWAEINWDAKQWELPAEKMKMSQPHIVPLSKQALALLRDIERHTAHRGKYVFPSQRGASRPLSDNGVRTAMRTMGYDNDTMTPHGFRAMARTILDEVLQYRVDWIEHQLAHAVRDPNGRAYNRTAHLADRHKMMQGWADYLDNLKAQTKAGNVVTADFGVRGSNSTAR
jgi:integrase